MRPVVVVGVGAVAVEDARLHHGVEDLPGEELVAELAVEALDEGVLTGTAGLYLRRGRPITCVRLITAMSLCACVVGAGGVSASF